MQHAKHETEDLRLSQILLHCRVDHWQVILMHHFIPLEEKGPVTGAMRQRNILLESKDTSVFSKLIVPNRLHDFDLGSGDRTDQFEGIILPSPNIDHKLVHDGQG